MKLGLRTHRVGALTSGISMLVLGILCLVHTVSGSISYRTIFKMWPLMIIGIGIEMLVSEFDDKKYIYDKAAVVLLLIVCGLAMVMALVEICELKIVL